MENEAIPTPLTKSIQYIRSRIYSPLKAEEVAGYSGYSNAYFSKIFKEQTGKGVHEFIVDCKLQEAAELLQHTERPISEISNLLFFSNQSHFQRQFRRKFQVTPKQYRQRSREDLGTQFQNISLAAGNN